MKPRRWFRFSLRTCFVVLTLFAVWLGVQVKWVSDRRAARQWIAEHQPQPEAGRYTWYTLSPTYTRPPLPWVLKALREQPVHLISIAVGPDDREDVERLRKLFPEAEVLTIPNP